MLLRIRASFGTPRVEVSDSATLKDLKQMVFNLLKKENVPIQSEEDLFLSLNPSGSTPLLDNDAPLSKCNVSHGTMLYLITDAPPSSSASSSAPSKVEPTSEASKPKCTHPPNAKCVHCTPAQPPQPAPAPKTTGTGKKIKWLCTHPPGAKCVNCMRPPKKNATGKCNHPSYIHSNHFHTLS